MTNYSLSIDVNFDGLKDRVTYNQDDQGHFLTVAYQQADGSFTADEDMAWEQPVDLDGDLAADEGAQYILTEDGVSVAAIASNLYGELGQHLTVTVDQGEGNTPVLTGKADINGDGIQDYLEANTVTPDNITLHIRGKAVDGNE